MNYLVDSHIILWSLLGSSALPDEARQILEDESNSFFYSMANVWEIGIKHALGRSDFIVTARRFAEYCEEAGYTQIGITVDHVEMLDTLKTTNDHRDPFDRLLLAQAKAEGFKFLSHDGKLNGYSEKCVVSV